MRLKSPFVIGLLVPLLFAFPAQAHDLLVDIEPVPGAVVTEGDFEAKLSFNNPLLVVEGKTNAELATKLVGSDDWVTHEVEIVDQVLTARISLSESGDYDLRWKVVSSDGHPISGDSTFTLAIDDSAELDNSESPIVIAPAPSNGQNSDEGSLVGFYVGLAMVVLGVIFAPIGLMIRRRARKS
jgi:methionine-rich copper-binding protein CopC